MVKITYYTHVYVYIYKIHKKVLLQKELYKQFIHICYIKHIHAN